MFISSLRRGNFDEIFRKDMTYSNIRSRRKPVLHPKGYILGNTTGRGD